MCNITAWAREGWWCDNCKGSTVPENQNRKLEDVNGNLTVHINLAFHLLTKDFLSLLNTR